MEKNSINNFWEHNPCGESLLEENHGRIEGLYEFFLAYDAFRYNTEKHILTNLDKLDFKGKKILEIGIGQAADAQKIIEKGALYHGLDFTQESCHRALARFEMFHKPYKGIVRGDAADIPFQDNYFDMVYSHGALHHIPNIERVVCELYRVLKKDGRIIIMLYARHSFNYYWSILFMRRILFAGLFLFDIITGKKAVKNKLFREHIQQAQEMGFLKYLSTKNFLSKNTDGPENPYSRVYTAKDVENIFCKFNFDFFEHHFLNERHLFFLKIIPMFLKRKLAKMLGWHLWCYGIKK